MTDKVETNAHKLSLLESFIQEILVSEAIKKLQFCSRIANVSGINNKPEIDDDNGNQIFKTIQDQRELEQRQSKLMSQRASQLDLANKKLLRDTERQLEEVQTKLKESTKNLCRSLKEESPNMAANIMKIQFDREEIIKWLTDLTQQLGQQSQQGFYNTVKEEKSKANLLREKKDKDQDLTKRLNLLKQNIREVEKTQQIEVNDTHQTIQKMKTDLTELKTSSAITLRQKENNVKAYEATLKRIQEEEVNKLQEVTRNLDAEIQLEKKSHDVLKLFLEKRKLELEKETEYMEAKMKEEKEKTQETLDFLKEQRKKDKELLKNQEELLKKEAAERIEQEKKELREIELQKEREAMEIKRSEAATFIQRELSLFIESLRNQRGKRKKKQTKTKKKKN